MAMLKAEKRLSRRLLKERLYQRRFLVPNAVTLGNMFCGFLACMYAATGRFEKAVIAIGFAILLDGLDGRVARRLNATSKFGVEFDSFSDLVSFGVAPALLIYHWAFWPLADELGVPFTFLFVLCAASRLARFNISQDNLKSFLGLPTPGAAGMLVASVNCYPHPVPSVYLTVLAAALLTLLSYLMVSKIEFFSIKMLTMNRIRLLARISLGALIALIWYRHQIGFVVLAGTYCLSGPCNHLLSRRKRSRSEEMFASSRMTTHASDSSSEIEHTH